MEVPFGLSVFMGLVSWRGFKEPAGGWFTVDGLWVRGGQLVHAERFRADFHKRENGVGRYLHSELLTDGLGNAPIAPALLPAVTDEFEVRLQLGLEGASGHYVLPPKRCEVVPSRTPSDPKPSQVFKGE